MDNVSISMPKISVIVPMYNCEAYIEECLDSLQNQTMDDFEAICIDDASTDNTLEKARATVREDERFSFIASSANGGQSIARNAGLDKASGEYIVFLDSDDYLALEALEKLWERVKEQQLDDLYFSALSVYDSAEATKLLWEEYNYRTPFEGVATGQELFTFFENENSFLPHAALRMVKRSLIEKNNIRFYEGIIHEDALFTFQTLVESKKSSYLNEVLYYRRIRMGSTMVQPKRTIPSIHGHFICTQEMRHWLYQHADEVSEEFIEALTHRIFDWLNTTADGWHSDINEQDKKNYLASLTPKEKVAFYEDIIHRGRLISEAKKQVQESAAFLVGEAIVKAPRYIKKRLVSFKHYLEKPKKSSD